MGKVGWVVKAIDSDLNIKNYLETVWENFMKVTFSCLNYN